MKEKLPLFFDNFNTLLAKLSFYKLTRQAMKDFGEVIEWVEVANRTLFSGSNLKATIYLFENSYQAVLSSQFKQKRRSLPIESTVLEAFPEIYKDLIKFIQGKLLLKKSEIRLALVF